MFRAKYLGPALIVSIITLLISTFVIGDIMLIGIFHLLSMVLALINLFGALLAPGEFFS